MLANGAMSLSQVLIQVAFANFQLIFQIGAIICNFYNPANFKVLNWCQRLTDHFINILFLKRIGISLIRTVKYRSRELGKCKSKDMLLVFRSKQQEIFGH